MGFQIPYSEEEINLASKKISPPKCGKWLCSTSCMERCEMMAISAQQTKIHVAIATWN